ncbi:MAG: translation elongation factor-like protein [Patescibacteria group bacterium]|nr:translation elongation factor-like protein [Patescibacteria group bacterium]
MPKKTKTTSKSKKSNKKSKSKTKIVKSKAKTQKKEKLVGVVTHYFDKISVAALKLKAPLSIGDKILFRSHLGDLFEQEVTSMQIEHEPVKKAKKGDEVGIKVIQKVHEGNEIYLVE